MTAQLLASTQKKLDTVNAAATYAAVHPRTIRRLVANGHLTGYRLGSRILRIDLNELDALLRVVPTAGGDSHDGT